MSLFNREKLQEIQAKSSVEHKHTVMLVDDEPANLTVLANMLQTEYNIVTAQSGEEALEILAEEDDKKFSVIISDQRMPSMTGIEMLERVRESHPDIIRIILTGYTDVSALMDGINRAQIYQFLLKPINRELVLLTVKRGVEALERDRELQHRAMYDWITKLPNRYLLTDRAEHEILLAKREQHNVALMLIDIRRFKEVNESLGHKVGDQLLAKLGQLIKETLRESDTVAHLNSGRFAVLLTKVTKKDVSKVTSKLQHCLTSPVQMEGISIDIDTSVGASIYPMDALTTDELLQHAEIACDVAKSAVVNEIFYESSLDRNSIERLSLMGELKTACEIDQLELYYQPKISLDNGKATHAEALIRWNHPERGFVSPLDFIPLAEQTGTIIKVTEWVVAHAIDQIAQWKKNGMDLHVAINVSAVDLESPRLVGYISHELAKHELSANHLTLEITESSIMKNPVVASKTLENLAELGVDLSIDDFGTGYSSMAQLKRMPVCELKIDRSFIMNISGNEEDKSIVEATISLGHHLGLKVVAEGVEDEESVNLLKGLGCDMVQGYFFSKPLDSASFLKWYQERK